MPKTTYRLEDLERQLAESRRKFRAADATIHNLELKLIDMTVQLANAESKCREMAAENAALKKAAEFATADDMWIEQADGMLDYRYVDWYVDVMKSAMETPATDAFLAEVRAQGEPVSAITPHFDTIALETATEIMCDVNRRNEFLGGDVQLLSRIQCRIDDACRAAMLQGAEPVQRWIPCSEQMPKVGEYVLCLDGLDRHGQFAHDDVYTAAYCNRMDAFTTEYYGDHDWMSKSNPTHWAPIPKIPAAPQQEVKK